MTITSDISKGRLIGIDALRGIAAFLVVVFHVFGSTDIFLHWLPIDKLSLSTIPYFIPAFGYSGVFLFFVISGFCIHLRYAKSLAGHSSQVSSIDFLAFWKRRWIRLYPAYLAAIVLFVYWEYHIGKITFDGFFLWDLISHILLIHNLDNRTVYSMNNVFWTLAIEEQLYLLYFLMLSLRNRLGWRATIVISIIARFLWLGVSLAVTKLSGFQLPFHEGALANWWIWILGAFAVENYYRVIEFPRWCYSRFLTCILLFSAGIMHYLGASSPATPLFAKVAFVFEPIVWGAGFFLLINYVTALEPRLNTKSTGFKMIKGAAFVGVFSYSLYLIHELIAQQMTGLNRYLICFSCVGAAYCFYWLFERPSMYYLATHSPKKILKTLPTFR